MMTLLQTYGADLIKAICEHTIYVLISEAIGFSVGLVCGILLSRVPRWLSGIISPVLSIFQTIPGLVFILSLIHISPRKTPQTPVRKVPPKPLPVSASQPLTQASPQ